METTDHDDLKVSIVYFQSWTFWPSFQEIFRTMDTDASGTINIKELFDYMTAVGGDIDIYEVTEPIA